MDKDVSNPTPNRDMSPIQQLASALRDVPDFPKPGILFKDITPILQSPELFKLLIEEIAAPHRGKSIQTVVGIDARGFIIGSAVALALGAGFVPVRKEGKLPWKTISESYTLEYGTNTVEIHEDALALGNRVLLVDDLLATGGTASAAVHLLRKLGAEIEEIVFFIELGFLNGRTRLDGFNVRSLIAC